jgi:hypothetical protein
MRGQAFVVFKEVGESAAAKNNLNGYPVFGKPMVDLEAIVENILRGSAQQDRHLRREMILGHLICVSTANAIASIKGYIIS